jgi:hypothetical protein
MLHRALILAFAGLISSGCVVSQKAYRAIVPDLQQPIDAVVACRVKDWHDYSDVTVLAKSGRQLWRYRIPSFERAAVAAAERVPGGTTLPMEDRRCSVDAVEKKVTGADVSISLSPDGPSVKHRLIGPDSPQRGRKALFALVAPFTALADLILAPFEPIWWMIEHPRFAP